MNMLEHLKLRWFNVELYSGVVVDTDNCTFPLWNLSGQMVGYQTYSPLQPKNEVGDPRLQKYFSWVTKPCASKNAELAVWGLETLQWDSPLLFITEGVFDACRLHWNGLPAVAVLSNNPLHLDSWFKDIPAHIVACVQGDSAGRKLAKFGDEAIFLPDGKDVGDLSEEEFLNIFSRWL